MNELQRTGYKLLEATAYGDAAGLPVESWDAFDIELTYGYISELIPASTHPFFSQETLPGCWSDDTELSLAVAEGLIAADGFDIDVQAECFLQAYQSSRKIMHKGKLMPRGWGGSTVNSAERLLAGIKPQVSGEANGVGNGVLIKLAPLVFWQVARDTGVTERHHQYDELTAMTHAAPIAKWATRVHGDFLHYILSTDEDNFIGKILDSSVAHEWQLGLDNEGTRLLSFLMKDELIYQPDLILSYTDRKGFYVPQTMAMAYGIFILCATDFKSTVYEAVNLGGDTDSTASIVATLMNFAAKGDIVMPEDADCLRQHGRLQQASKDLADIALKAH